LRQKGFKVKGFEEARITEYDIHVSVVETSKDIKKNEICKFSCSDLMKDTEAPLGCESAIRKE